MLPEIFLDRMKGMLGEEFDDFVRAYEHEPHHALRLNPLKINLDGTGADTYVGAKNAHQGTVSGNREGGQASERAEKTENHADEREVGRAGRKSGELPDFLQNPAEVPWEGNGYYYEEESRPGRHPLHEGGVYYIQEPSAMAPVPLLRVKPGEKVLDLCAAPGGKSTQIAAYLGGKGILVCNEIHPQRAKILSGNVERMGVVNAMVTNEDPINLVRFFPQYFDKILVDAPCSGEGMFRKNEEACAEWSPENVELCARRQDEILDAAVQMLSPTGRIVYSTCTFNETEDEGSVERFLERHPDFEALERTKLLPHKVRGEGHFAAVLAGKPQTREGSETETTAGGYRSMPYHGLCVGLSQREIRSDIPEFVAFIRENLCDTPKSDIGRMLRRLADGASEKKSEGKPETEAASYGRLLRWKDELYLVPVEMPSAQGLKVLRMGLHVGTVKKNRFEPAHALALALPPADFQICICLDSKENAVMQFLNGQTLPAGEEKGWCLVCADGFGIGWGKAAGGILKNHYPKGLRINL